MKWYKFIKNLKKQYKVYLIDMTVKMPPATRMIAQASLEILLSDSRVWVRPPIVVKCKNHLKTEVKLPQVVVELPTFLHMLSVMKNNLKLVYTTFLHSFKNIILTLCHTAHHPSCKHWAQVYFKELSCPPFRMSAQLILTPLARYPTTVPLQVKHDVVEWKAALWNHPKVLQFLWEEASTLKQR